MSRESVKFQYHTGIVVGNYSFSANNDIITLSGYVEKLEDDRIREAIKFEAITARAFYVDELNRRKLMGDRINSSNIKSEATRRAKVEAKDKYFDIWDMVENIYKIPPKIFATKPTIKLLIKLPTLTERLAQFTLYKGAQLDASIICPKRLIEMHEGIYEDTDIEERINNQVLKCVMGECTEDITGKCTLKEVVELIRALNHKQEIELTVW